MKLLFLTSIFLTLFSYSHLHGQEFKYKKKLGKYIYKSSKGLDYDKQYDEVLSSYKGTWKVRNGSEWGLVNYGGELIANVIYEQINFFVGDYAIVKNDGKYGVINKQGEEILKTEFDRIDYYNEKECIVQKEGIWGKIDNGDFQEIEGGIVFRNPDEKPILKSCIGKEENCTMQEMLKLIFSNINYPEEAIQAGIEGTVVTEIVIDKQGNLDAVNILRKIGGGCEEEAIRLITSYLTDWQPGKQDGITVKSRYVFPIRYKLE